MSKPEPSLVECDEVRTRVDNRIGFIELNRPQALNALSLPMIRAMHAALDAWRDDPRVLAVVAHSAHARAFCAGGDVRYFYEAGRRGDVAARDAFFTEEYALDHAIFTYGKPYIALMQGVVMGGGMGISQGAHRTGGLRIVSETTKMAMPETRIGLFPDVGAGWFLARTPGAIGRYLAVTGSTIDAADALYAGLADAYLDTSAIPALIEALASAQFADAKDVLACVEGFASRTAPPLARPGEGGRSVTLSLAATRTWIDRHFAQPDVTSIVESLEAETEPGAREWAQETIRVMRERSPLSMAVSLEVVARAEGPMSDCLRRDLDLTRSIFDHGDIVEGVRARIVDKDDRPVWRIARIEDVTRAEVENMFVSAWTPDTHPLRHLLG
ncbi:enoyl-CoA hydratase/isomerase family protein [Trinickia dinghuensis]|uniref:Enoyl-CoA hydratase/isomerase family protein n=1 Tax=Trinickia dinghuensis TaxID=2291023 RepID=A0A3D8JRF1_9BURK|nr:enoyl-CoA hydratase/isomerase family protein [Trinickia dinghuensis]RDU95305.1 enoyl-CoA hydratase/isomerase family protein [Trinickia dinghuensis]